jgi:translation initiation factor 6
MPIFQTDFFGENYLGLFGFATDDYCLVSNRLSSEKLRKIEDILGTATIPTSVYNFALAGIMSAGNKNGVLLPYLVEDSEVKTIGEHVETTIVPDKFTALGNLVAANDHGGVISDVFSIEAKEIIDELLGFETFQGRIASSSEAGVLCIATNRGFVVTPDASDEEMKKLEKIFGVPGGRASANMGSKMVGACIIANSKGFITGTETTPIELEYINEALGFF